jgi:glycosyltransferase involved in cell wall biosynthesis
MAAETWVASPVDQARLAQLGGSAAVVVPNPIPDESFAELPIRPERYAAPHAIFIGHLAYPPNVMAATELARNIWPRVVQERPDASVAICGRTPGSQVTELGGLPGVQVSPDPVEVGSLYRQAGYTLMPVRQGSGTRIKVLEAMAAGTIVIATRKAVEGLSLVAGAHYLAAEDVNDFARHFVRGLQRPDAMAILAERARTFVLEQFGKRALTHRVRARLTVLARTAVQNGMHLSSRGPVDP